MRPLTLCLGLVVLGTVAALGAACGDDAPAPAAPAAGEARAPVAAAPAASAAPVAAPDALAVPQAYQYAYNPLGKRDPFRSFDEVNKTSAGESGGSACIEPLCQFNLEQLTLVAVVSGDANPIAMVEDPATIGHLIHRNTRMGKQGGKVTQILRDCIIVTEYWTGPDGKSNANPVKVCVKAERAEVAAPDLMNPGKSY